MRRLMLARQQQALAAMDRVVSLYEELAEKRPGSFLPELAEGLVVRSAVHRSLGNATLALRDIVTGVGHLWPCFERQPAEFAGLMGMMLQSYENYLDGAEPDELMDERNRQYNALIA
jgi:hypothetical protein